MGQPAQSRIDGGHVRPQAWRALALALLLAAFAGCATPPQRQAEQLRRSADRPPVIILMPIDVELSQLTAGGLEEPQAEWTQAAQKHMRAALEDEARIRSVKLVDFSYERGTGEDRETAADLVKLHRAVGGSVMLHGEGGFLPLPTKQGRKFDWSLGPAASVVGKTHEADYAMFIFVRDSYATAGRQAAIVVAALLGVGLPGGTQVGFASVVDLKTGDIVWFNRLIRAQGDLRTPEHAAETMRALVHDALK
jgi:hypothetical protein